MYEQQTTRLTPEGLILFLVSNPDQVVGQLSSAEIRNDPERCAQVLAAADRCRWVGEFSPRVSGGFWYKLAWRKLEGSDYWQEALSAVEANRANPHELQLVLESAARPGGDDASRALSGFVRYRYGQTYNPTSPQLLACAQTELMRDMGLFKKMDVRDPNPLIAPMTQRLQLFIRAAERSISPALASEYGHDQIAPQQVLHTAKALGQFNQDSAAYRNGHTAVAYAYGRAWRSLGGPESVVRDWNKWQLRHREYYRNETDKEFYETFSLDPSELNVRLDSSLRRVYQVMEMGRHDSPAAMFATETITAAWAVATLRQHEPAIRQVIERHWQRVQHVLEPYVLDGLPLLARGRASKPLSLIIHESWYDNDDMVSVFTPFYGTESSDREAAGQVMSDYLRLVYDQDPTNPNGQPSLGYQPNAPELGIVMAYKQLFEIAGTDYPPGMLRLYVDRFQSTVRGLEGYSRKANLPRDVTQAIQSPRLLAGRLHRARNQALG